MDDSISIYNVDDVHISSLEIADITGKAHKNVLRDIKVMEESWEKTCGLKFELTSKLVKQPNGGFRKTPFYSLNRLEFLYVITKYSNEMRAKLVLRWYELEKAVRNVTDRKAQYYDEVMESKDSFTVRKVAAPLRMTAQDLNKMLCRLGVQYGQSGSYLPYAPFARKGYCKSRTYKRHLKDGTVRTEHRTTWTEPGISFIVELVQKERARLIPRPKFIQLSFIF